MFVESVFEKSLSLAYLTNQIQERVTTYVQRMLKDGYIDEKTLQYLIQTNVKPGRFYILPKIHKTGNPKRPIQVHLTATHKM